MPPVPPENTQSTLGDDEEANYDLFISRILETGKVWGLKADDGWAVCPSLEFEDTDVFPFWSDEADARVHCSEDWKIYTPSVIELEDFVVNWLPGMHEDEVMVGPNWNGELSGVEVEPADVAERLGIDTD
ncbi:MAG: DUF2750 domain-containing protein [Gammaproteobacteria bacterium]|nr:DUF2750 domain-containing protein [Pseudomonadales bacterium]MCP5331267.1 DUF2750 domain-containing protein [Pseudomonadales bacterium]